MSDEVLVGLGALVLAALVYFAGVKRGESVERRRQDHEREMEARRQAHARQVEAGRRENELVSKVADEYVDMVRRRYDSGIHALTRLGLDGLGSDVVIRKAIEEMKIRTGKDPWGSKAAIVDDVDLAAFFRYLRENRVDLSSKPLEEVAAEVRRAGGTRRR